MIFPRKKLILPCHKNGYLQSASDARKWRDRFKRNPLAKVADMFIPKSLRMSPGYPCCCGTSCSACGTTITSDGTVSWFEHEVDEDTGEITRVDKSGDCVTYYVDSVSGGGEESGTGTEEDPWTNLNTVFSNSCIYSICTTAGCPKVKVLVAGTIDYAIAGSNARNYGRNLVIEPGEGAESIEIIKTSAPATMVSNCIGVVFKHVMINATNYASNGNFGLDSCGNCLFDTCTVEITSTGVFNVGPNSSAGFHSCTNSSFDTCSATVSGTGHYTYLSGCNAGSGIGFTGCHNSTFRSCNGDGTGISIGGGSFAFCSHGEGRGFYYCTESIFYSCIGTGSGDCVFPDTGGINDGYGFNKCYDSVFASCSGYGYSTADPGVCCGFYLNTDSSFQGCTDTNSCSTPTCDSIS